MSSYRALLARPGARTLAFACAIAWLSYGGLSLAIVLAVESATGSFAAAGIVLSAFGVGVGVLAPWRGWCVDRRRSAIVAFAAVNALGLGWLVVGSVASWPPVAMVALAGAAGMSAPPVIAVARAVWPPISGPDLVRAGHSLNATLGDLGAALGPLLVGVLAAVLSGSAALALIAVGPVVASILVARLSSESSAPSERPPGLLVRRSAGLRVLVATELALGVALGGLDVVAPLAGAQAGSPALGAVPLSGFALGSVAGSLWSGRAQTQASPARRFLAGTTGLAVVLALGEAVPSVVGLTLLLLPAGAGFGVVNVAVFELLDVVVSRARGIEALTWLTSANGLGLAAGSALAGALSGFGFGAAIAIPAAAATTGAAITWSYRRSLQSEESSHRL